MILDQWGHGELDDLRASGGVSNGHLHSMLNPQYRSYGFGYVKAPTSETQRYSGAGMCTAGEGPGDNTPYQERQLTLLRPARSADEAGNGLVPQLEFHFYP